MSKTASRIRRGVHLNRSKRRAIRKKLLEAFGTRCYWCHEHMEIPVKGQPVKNINKMATLEHWLAQKKHKPDNIIFMRLAHKECNK